MYLYHKDQIRSTLDQRYTDIFWASSKSKHWFIFSCQFDNQIFSLDGHKKNLQANIKHLSYISFNQNHSQSSCPEY